MAVTLSWLSCRTYRFGSIRCGRSVLTGGDSATRESARADALGVPGMQQRAPRRPLLLRAALTTATPAGRRPSPVLRLRSARAVWLQVTTRAERRHRNEVAAREGDGSMADGGSRLTNLPHTGADARRRPARPSVPQESRHNGAVPEHADRRGLGTPT